MKNCSDLHNLHLLQGVFEGLLSSQMRNDQWVARFGFNMWTFNVKLCCCNLHYWALRSLSKFGPGCPQIHILVMPFWSRWSFATTFTKSLKVKTCTNGFKNLPWQTWSFMKIKNIVGVLIKFCHYRNYVREPTSEGCLLQNGVQYSWESLLLNIKDEYQ